MTDKPPIALFKGVTAELKLAFADLDIQRRYMPLVDAADLETTKVSVYIETIQDGKLVRAGFDTVLVTLGVAIQKLVAAPSVLDSEDNPVGYGNDNIAHGDEILSLVEEFKDLWRNGGALVDKEIAGFQFSEMVHDPVYEPFHLVTIGVFTSIIDVTYQLTKVV